jgi:hypothetical protein
MGTAAKQPHGAGKHDQYAEPRDLANGSQGCIGKSCKAEPHKDGAIRAGLQSAKTGIEAEEQAKQAPHVGHVGDGKRQEQRTEDQGKRGDDGVERGDSGADESALRKKSRDEGDEQS